MASANKPNNQVTVQLAASLLIGSLAWGAQFFVHEARAADFSRAKQTYVPPSKIPRRFDMESVRETFTAPSSYSAGMPDYSYSSSSSSNYVPPPTSGKSGKYGLIPPPPPLTPSILPPSLLTPQAMSASPAPLQALSAGPALKGNWKTSVNNGFTRVGEVSANADTTSRAISRAQELVTEGKAEDAQLLLKHYLKTMPKSSAIKTELTRVTLLRARQYMGNNELDAAAKQAREAVALDGASQPAKTLLSEILSKSGINAGNHVDRIKLGNQLLAQNKTTEATTEFKEALKIKPSADAYVGLGDVALKENRREQAKAEFQKALEVDPNSAAALRQMGVLRYQQNDVVGANADLSRALILNPHDKVASNHLIELWQRQVARSPQGANGHLGLARAHQLSGDLKSAQAEYKQVVRIEPENANLPAARQSFKLALARQDAHRLVETAHSLEAGGMTKDAHQKVVEALGLCPNDVSIRLYEAKLSEKLGLNHQARDAYLAVLKEDPKNATATQGLKALSSVTAPPVAPSISQTLNGMSATALGLNGASAPQEAPPGPAPPPIGPSGSGVTNMSNFLVSLRNLSLTQKQALSAAESSAHAAVKSSLGLSDGSDAAGSAAGGLPPDLSATVSQLTTAPAASVDSAGVESALAQANAALNAAGAPSSTTSSLASAAPSIATTAAGAAPSLLGMAMQAMPQLRGMTAPATAQAVTTTATGLTAAAPPPILPAPAGAAVSAPALELPPSLTSMAMQALPGLKANGASLAQMALQAAPQLSSGDLSKMNSTDLDNIYKKIRSPLEKKYGLKLPESIQKSPATAAATTTAVSSTVATPAGTTTTTAATTNSVATTAAAAAPSLLQQSNADLMPMPMPMPIADSSTGQQLSLADQNKLLQTQLAQANLTINSLKANGGSATAANMLASNAVPAGAGLITSAPSLLPELKGGSSGIKLELEGVSPTPADIKLKVVLKNPHNVPFDLPSGSKAVVRMNGKPQRNAKVSFPSKQVPAGGELHGTIKVPGHDLTPAADVLIPDFLPGGGADRDIHLTVPISSL